MRNILWNEKLTGKRASRFFTVRVSHHVSLKTKYRSPTAWEYPSCIYSPKNARDVAFAVRVLSFAGSKYAIRSGGHSVLPFWASIDEGVLISMTNVSDCSYDANTETARVGLGLTWGELYERLEPYDRLVVGGRVPPVGLALTIGGN